jgi:glucokinase
VNLFAGIDVGGTNVKIAVVSRTGRVLERGLIDTRPNEGPKATFERAATALASLLRGKSLAAAGVGCAGLIDPRKGMLLASPNLKEWENTPVLRIARRALGVYTTVDNDATSAAYGEYRCGSNRGCRHLIFLTLGTGVGGGVVSDGRLIRGAAGYGGEVGHITVDRDGPPCRCGNRGCLEAFAGTYGLQRRARELLGQRRTRYLTRWVQEERRRLSPKLIMEAARRGDSVGKRVAREMGESLGVAIASLVNVFNPEVVVIGGGVSGAFDLISPHIEREVARRAFDAAAAMARIEPSTLGNDATAVGAAMFARDSVASSNP